MKKIYIDKNDTAAAIAEKIIESEDKELVLYIPRFTKLINSINNFRVLKREIESSGKYVEIESVDDDVLEMSKTVGIKAGNPFFKKNRRAVSDIILPSEPKPSIPVIPIETGKKSRKKNHIDIEAQDDPSESPEHNKIHQHQTSHEEPIFSKLPKSSFKGIKSVFTLVLITIGGLLAVYAAGSILPSAHIAVTLEKINWDFTGSVLASTAVKNPSFVNGVARVSGVLLDKNKNITMPYPASGSESVQRKATGKITIYNAYSSDPQSLVKETRFASPDGKIFRITRSLTIPGAKIIDNKVVPSTIEADVVADKPGEEYNISPARFKIPGFAGSPKYDGFYGESTEPMTGGFVGVTKVATAADITKAKADITKLLENALKSEIVLLVPGDIKIIDNSTSFIVTKIDVDRVADDSGSFKATAYGNIRVIGFREKDLLTALESKVASDVSAEDVRNGRDDGEKVTLVLKKGYTITYGAPKLELANKQMSVPIKMHSVWVRAVDIDKFKTAVEGKTRAELASGPMPMLGIKSMNVDLWPFWVRHIPNNPAKITIDVE